MTSNPPIPMSMEEWNLRMREQKKQDLQNKNASARNLHSYRGGIVSEEDKKLEVIRQEEREKKKQAEEWNRSYTRNELQLPMEVNVAASSSTPKNNNNNSNSNLQVQIDVPHATVASKNDRDMLLKKSISPGFVSGVAANFNNSKSDGLQFTPQTILSSPSDEKKTETEPHTTPTIISNASVAKESPVESQETEDKPRNNQTPSMEIVQETPSQANDDPSKQATTEVKTKEDYYHPIPGKVVGDKSSSGLASQQFAVLENDMQQRQRQQKQDSTVDLLDVEFSFGLITKRSKPSYDEYIGAVEEIVKKELVQNVELRGCASFRSSNGAFIKTLKEDDNYVDLAGRTDVHRVFVAAVVPIFVQHSESHGVNSLKITRNAILQALRNAIRSGCLLSIAFGDSTTKR